MTSLSGCQRLKSIVSVELYTVTFNDMPPVAALTRLTKLSIAKTSCSLDLASLAHHPALEQLEMMRSKVCDLRVLQWLPRLRVLRLNVVKLQHPFDPHERSPLTNLRELDWVNVRRDGTAREPGGETEHRWGIENTLPLVANTLRELHLHGILPKLQRLSV